MGRRPDHRQRSAIASGTLVERQTRLVCLLHLPLRDGDSLHHALGVRLGGLPQELRRSITWDQGTEMARHLAITATLGTDPFAGLLRVGGLSGGSFSAIWDGFNALESLACG